MTAAVPDSLRYFIQSHFTLTLATAAGDTPWAAAVYYVCDDDLGLYFISDPGSRHVQEGLKSGRVAVAIHGAHQPWATISGVQLSGTLATVPQEDRARVEALYFARFTDVGMLVRAAVQAGGSRVAEKFKSSVFYRVTPRHVRHIDNTRGFGQPEEFEL